MKVPPPKVDEPIKRGLTNVECFVLSIVSLAAAIAVGILISKIL